MEIKEESTEKAIEVRKRKVVLSFHFPVAVPIEDGQIIMTHAVIAEIDERVEIPTHATIVGLGNGKPFKRSRNITIGYSSVGAVVDYEEG
jgi:hypothetical protein